MITPEERAENQLAADRLAMELNADYETQRAAAGIEITMPRSGKKPPNDAPELRLSNAEALLINDVAASTASKTTAPVIGNIVTKKTHVKRKNNRGDKK